MKAIDRDDPQIRLDTEEQKEKKALAKTKPRALFNASGEIYDWVMGVLDEEIRKATDNNLIPESASVEERGNLSLAMVVTYKKLMAFRNQICKPLDKQ